jgi:sulfotransferase family protein
VSVSSGGLEAWPDEEPTFALNVGGWALAATGVRFLHDADVLWEVPVDVERPDVAEANPGVDGAARSGFYATLSSLPLPPEFELRVVTGEGNEVGVIRGRRAALPPGTETGIRPLMLTGFSRTGSNLVLRLLGAHPEVVAYRPFQYEPRVLTYWLDVFRELTEPAAYLRQITTQGRIAERGWWLGTAPPMPRPLFDPATQRALALDTVEDAAGFCRSRIARVYERIAVEAGRPGARLFAEKQLPGAVPTIAWELYPDAREVFLVRDFRDMVASVLAWKARFGGAWFGHAAAEADLAFVHSLGRFAVNLVASRRRRVARSHVLRYEDLLADPEATVSALVTYLGIDPSRGELDAMAASLTQRTPESERYRTSETAEASIGRWRRDLPPDLQHAAGEAFAPALAEFGYET